MKRSISRTLFFALLSVAALSVAALSVPAAQAGDVEHAEHIRIGEEMKKLAARNAWNAVEASYQKLLLLAEKGEVLSYDDHWLGALAARDAGNAAEWKKRLLRAQAIKDSEEVKASLGEIASGYGEVRIIVDPKSEVVPDFQVKILPFAPDQAANVRFVEKRVESYASYEGPLAAGSYSLPGANPAEFTVEAGSTTAVVVKLGNIDKAAFEVAVGPRFGVGGQFLAGTAPDSAAATFLDGSTTGELEGGPGSFSLMGGRLSGGVEINFAPDLTFYVEAQGGYAAGAPVIDSVALSGFPGNSGFQAMGEAGIGYRVLLGETEGEDAKPRALWFHAGVPVGLISNSVAMEVALPASYDVVQTDEGAATQHIRGQRSGAGLGLELSLAIGLAPVGKKMDAALALEGGALYSPGDRLYPYGTAGIQFLPRFPVSR